MKYTLLIHQGAALGEFEGSRRTSRRDLRRVEGDSRYPGVSPGLQLQPPEAAATVRVQNGETLTTDGPFAESKEAIVALDR